MERIELTAQSVFDDPHSAYGPLREASGAQWNDSLRGWIGTRHAEVKAALKDTRLSVEKLEPFAERVGGEPHSELQRLAAALADWMVFKDPPRHASLRKAMQNAFMARDTPVLEPMIQSVVDELLEPLIPRAGERRTIDFIHAFAHRVPSVVISDLFGLPRSERERLNDWSNDLGEFVLGSTDAPHRRERAAACVQEMCTRFQRLIDEHRREPRDDFTQLLLRDGSHLTDGEIVHTLILVLFAGHETTANLIGSGLLTCLRYEQLMRRLRCDPALMEPAIEEFLRLEGPVQMVFRIAKRDLELGGARIREGERVHLVLNAANRDPAIFDAPNEVDLQRRRFQHVSFGPGTHMCLGAPLARLVGNIALAAVLTRLDDIRLEHDDLRWRRQLIVHGLTELPVSFAARDE